MSVCLPLSVCLCLSVCLFVCLCVFKSVWMVSVSLSVCASPDCVLIGWRQVHALVEFSQISFCLCSFSIHAVLFRL